VFTPVWFDQGAVNETQFVFRLYHMLRAYRCYPSLASGLLNGKHNLETHVLALVHQLAINDNLMGADTVILRVGWVFADSNLDLTPLTIRRDESTLEREANALLINAAFAVWR
jgi:hypothetical protein